MNEETAYYIVNPAGTIHVVTYDHAKNRLRQVGYRLATDEEIAVYEETHIQRFDRPIARPWSPEPEPEPELAAEAGVNARAREGDRYSAEAGRRAWHRSQADRGLGRRRAHPAEGRRGRDRR